MKVNVTIYGVAAGSYRTQNLLKALLDTKDVNVFFLNVRELWGKKTLFVKIQQMLVEAIVVAKSDIIIIPAVEHIYSYRYRLAKFFKKRIVTDFYISYYDSYVNDGNRLPADSPEAKKYYNLDREAILKSDCTIFLNQAEADYYTNVLNVKLSEIKYQLIPLCVDSRGRGKNLYASGRSNVFKICWWGTYIPLHGIEKIIDAVKILSAKNVDFEVYLFGNSEEKSVGYREKIKQSGLDHLIRVENDKSFNNGALEPFLINNCDLALGSFGDSSKAKTVFINKIADAFALGVPMLTMTTTAIEQLLSTDSDIIICNNTPNDIADTIFNVMSDKERLLRVGNNGFQKYESIFSYNSFKEKIASLILDKL
ncbi:glycosyltransferase [Dyadobacter sp. CY347]|uniref:glycosyltransferase n=1 Tax=Dyadobacter sp. CY347 TaxID=2909336 RepID=UPI001F1B1574|nr:glycosyltransferase [Dyadobacter sp. CY347]MCF2491093.1 glycosyltransferase [Dyadobacter sp. CY347]